jgi:hypothetical protein
MRFTLLLAAAGAALLSLPAFGDESSYGRTRVSEIMDRIAVKDCAGAVGDLNAALKKDYAEVQLLAGTMYEHGVCVKRDWDRAVPFYIQSWQGGIKDAANRLAAGYAAPENADVAAALWWASRERDRDGRVGGIAKLTGCTVNPAATGDMDRFVAELQTWPQSRLASCNYMTGVMATIAAELRYPTVAGRYDVGGDVNVRFLPGVPRVDLKLGAIRTIQMSGWIDGDATRERESIAKDGFKQALNQVTARALGRYPHPDDIPADTLVEFTYRFDVEYVSK